MFEKLLEFQKLKTDNCSNCCNFKRNFENCWIDWIVFQNPSLHGKIRNLSARIEAFGKQVIHFFRLSITNKKISLQWIPISYRREGVSFWVQTIGSLVFSSLQRWSNNYCFHVLWLTAFHFSSCPFCFNFQLLHTKLSFQFSSVFFEFSTGTH